MDKEAQEKIIELIQGRLINPSICQGHNKTGICYGAVDIGYECNQCMAIQIVDLMKELGYRKPLEGKPPLLSEEQMREYFELQIPKEQRNELFYLLVIDYMTELLVAAQAQRDSDWEWFKGSGNASTR